ncbi:hypothetical protein LEP1GSC059_2779 [Leptospira noguchii serovar Panama str. CZ214]|uniref:Uncharacterized protein n=1 Tax=Leptospira noguchii serovar Panama str. CZ214 TaxID=1001595 RepID=T0FP78_9LEPT|nr:hypothetical protein LEP1GSC059_2779 [Leptospira noguchii serovar Panama str. CZ214]
MGITTVTILRTNCRNSYFWKITPTYVNKSSQPRSSIWILIGKMLGGKKIQSGDFVKFLLIIRVVEKWNRHF